MGSIGKSLTPIKDLLITGNKIPYVQKDALFSKILISYIVEKTRMCVSKTKKLNKISIITDGDTARAASKFTNIQKLKASDIMTKNPTFIDEMILAPEALAIMNKKRITVLLVRSKGKFKGLVNIHSIIEFMNK